MPDTLLPLECVKFYCGPISSPKVSSKQMTIYPFRIAFSITLTLRVLPSVSNKEGGQSWESSSHIVHPHIFLVSTLIG